MRILFVVWLNMIAVVGYAQCTYPTPKKSAPSIAAFVPGGWFIRDSVRGDFNQDMLEDVVLILAEETEKIDTLYNHDCNRALLILQKSSNGYILSEYCKQAVLCKSCGGVFGDPLSGISLKKNVLTIQHYGGSAWKWYNQYTFRYANGVWKLIGATEGSFWSLGECDEVTDAAKNLSDVNFSTRKMHIVRTKDDACKPYKDTWMSFNAKPPVLLKNFNVGENYIPKD